MRMNGMFTVLRLLVLGMLVVGFNAQPAGAQHFQGKFNLPSATRWNGVTLPAGDYSFTLDHAYPGGKFVVSRGMQCVAQIPARGFNYTTSGRSEIVMESGTVREVSLPQIGVSLHYPAPNPRRRAPQELQAAQIIPIAAAGAAR